MQKTSKFRLWHTLPILFVSLIPCFGQDRGYTEIINQAGAKISAIILDKSSTELTLRRKDGLVFKIQQDQLSSPDGSYFSSWTAPQFTQKLSVKKLTSFGKKGERMEEYYYIFLIEGIGQGIQFGSDSIDEIKAGLSEALREEINARNLAFYQNPVFSISLEKVNKKFNRTKNTQEPHLILSWVLSKNEGVISVGVLEFFKPSSSKGPLWINIEDAAHWLYYLENKFNPEPIIQEWKRKNPEGIKSAF